MRLKLLFFTGFLNFLNLSAQTCTSLWTFDDTADLTIQFTDLSTSDPNDPIVTWSWDFGDGTTSSQQNPVHTFPDLDEKYDVLLTITTQNGCTAELEIQIEFCGFTVSYSFGSCDTNGDIPMTVSISDILDNAGEIDVILDGQNVPGSPFPIDAANPVNITFNVPGDGLNHNLLIQSLDIPTCFNSIDFTVTDCNSNCFFSALNIEYTPTGITHIVDVGDNYFAPSSTALDLGDVVDFVWVGDGHSSTSDATSGPDSWNSGVISAGSTFTVNIDEPGVHPFYCIPHGGPGGTGMSGELLSNCPTGNTVSLDVSFNTTVANSAGFDILWDGTAVAGSPFNYNGTGAQLVTINQPGDGMSHMVDVIDVNDPSCMLNTNYLAPDCNQGGGNPVCSMSVNTGNVSACDTNDEVAVEVIVDISNGGSGFNLTLDANAPIFFNYNGNQTTVSINIPGDGLSHSIVVEDDIDTSCSANTSITTTDCTVPCSITNVVATPPSGNGTPSGIFHTVNVEDFQFTPSVISITEGDQVEWVWTGSVDHTSTSDATSGPDSWDSGLNGQGFTYLSPVLTQGNHPYYCIPHGSPGGVGMSGEIDVLPPCNANDAVAVIVTFDVASPGATGFNIIVDGTSFGPFTYAGGVAQSETVNVTGDNMSHAITVQDIDDINCNGNTTVITPDCNGGGGGGPTCSLILSAALSGSCDTIGNIPVDLTITPSNAGTSFTVSVDAVVIGSYNYAGSGNTIITINIIGDGLSHTIDIVDDSDATCTASTNITTPDCSLPCSITNLMAIPPSGNGTPSGIFHTVNVEDFQFTSSVINITEGDQVEWIWTGSVDHTSTSDATGGPDSWDSGLLGQGSTYLSPVLTQGNHPYYCIPHGAPGGVGMAGEIVVLPPCNANDEVAVLITFDITSGGTSGYNILVDGVTNGPFSYVGGPAQSVSLNISGDAMNHSIVVQDIDDPTCNASTNVTTPDCNGGGGGGPTCSLTLSASVSGICDSIGFVPVDLTILPSNAGSSFTVSVDGNSIGSFNYSGSGITIITINITGDGLQHIISITDDSDSTCTASTEITTQDCSLPCGILNLIAAPPSSDGTPSGIIHTVDVEDFQFNPVSISISSGDQIEWVWTGAIAHTTTSDEMAGDDSWDSGLLGQGSSFQSPILSEGNHLYYCIPHGAPGGIGMAGNIEVLPPCNENDEVAVVVSFDAVGVGNLGYNIIVDSITHGPFVYVGGLTQSTTIDVLGNNLSHSIIVQDIENTNCNDITSVTTPDCSGGGGSNLLCNLSLTGSVSGSCDSTGYVPVSLLINALNASNGFSVLVDSIITGHYNYSDSLITKVEVPVIGNGKFHMIEVIDNIDTLCSTNLQILTPDCSLPCSFNDISVAFNDTISHTIEVKDFEFFPKDIVILQGDTLLFNWTGFIPHTASSDAIIGSDVFDSGLLTEGESFELVLNNAGTHPYYCIPHGAPGGIGMAGTIEVLPRCKDGFANGRLNFNYNSSSGSGFNIYLDTIPYGQIPYLDDGSGCFSTLIKVVSDTLLHSYTIEDAGLPTCFSGITFMTPDCQSNLCELSAELLEITACDGNEIELMFSVYSNQPNSNFTVKKENRLIDQFSTDDSGDALISFLVSGTGKEENFTFYFEQDSLCQDSLNIFIPDCVGPCLITEFDPSAGPIKHIIQVRDFDFFPPIRSILLGDTIHFEWVGNIPHTATSDVISGEDTFDSGLLGQNATFDVVLNNPGDHPYYCIPHGGPGGIGMAGIISVIDTCDADIWTTNMSFSVTAGSNLGYNLYLNGSLINNEPINYENPLGKNSQLLSIPADGLTYNLTIQDVETSYCAFTSPVTSGICDTTCVIESLEVYTGSEIIHEIEVRDFNFFPKNISVNAGETVRFVWTGNIPHTSTSDLITGPSSWESGLLGNGETFDIVINDPGEHLYYCIPHGGPGGRQPYPGLFPGAPERGRPDRGL